MHTLLEGLPHRLMSKRRNAPSASHRFSRRARHTVWGSWANTSLLDQTVPKGSRSAGAFPTSTLYSMVSAGSIYLTVI